MSEETSTTDPKTTERKPAEKSYVLARFPGSDDPAAADPVYFSHNGIPYLVPRETEFCIKREAISHLFEPETRLVAKQDPITGEWRQTKKSVAFNRPEIIESLTEKEAQPYLQKQLKDVAAERARQKDENNRVAQSA